jgi:hypothetical protein
MFVACLLQRHIEDNPSIDGLVHLIQVGSDLRFDWGGSAMPVADCVVACVTEDRMERLRNLGRPLLAMFGSLPADEGADYVDTAADIPSLMRLKITTMKRCLIDQLTQGCRRVQQCVAGEDGAGANREEVPKSGKR